MDCFTEGRLARGTFRDRDNDNSKDKGRIIVPTRFKRLSSFPQKQRKNTQKKLIKSICEIYLCNKLSLKFLTFS